MLDFHEMITVYLNYKAQNNNTSVLILGNPIGKNPANLHIEIITSENKEEKKREREREKMSLADITIENTLLDCSSTPFLFE